VGGLAQTSTSRVTGAALALAALIAVLVSLAGSADRAPAAFAGKNARISIESDRDSGPGVVGNQVFTMNQHGGGLRQLTCCVPTDSANFSPNAKLILFSQVPFPPATDQDVVVTHADGTGQKNLTEGNRDDRSASFSPNGKRILFASNRTGHYQLYLMHADGSDQHQVTHDSRDYRDPVFFPSGKKIAFGAGEGDNADIFSMALNGKHRRRLTHNASFEFAPDVSPNGKKIAFDKDRANDHSDLFVMRSNGTHVRRLTNTRSADEFDHTFSPDSRKIAFDKITGGAGDFDIFVMKASGKHKHLLLGGPSNDRISDWARKR
jgi:Tol biopolymer transport system component